MVDLNKTLHVKKEAVPQKYSHPHSENDSNCQVGRNYRDAHARLTYLEMKSAVERINWQDRER